jgi:hypothetical protein
MNLLQKKNMLICKNNTNIMKFELRNRIVFEMRKKIHDETDKDKMMLEGMDECLMNPVNYTEITHPDSENL